MSLATQVEITAQNPWPGLGAFDEGAEQFFNGRDEEAAELRRLVLNAPLATLFGLSGLGKTSLLQAGLFPLLRREHVLPVYVRLDYETVHEPLSEQIKRALQREMLAHHVDAPSFAEGETLWEYLHTTCQAPSAAQLAKLDSAGVIATFEPRYLSSTTAIALVLEQLERAVREPNTARAVNATEFLARTRNAAWNQAQVCWAGDVVRLARDAASGQESVEELQALLPRLKPKLDSIVPDSTQASLCPPERPSGPVPRRGR